MKPRSILITGASSGLGAALARVYAGPSVRLALGGRSRDRLDGVADVCRMAGSTVDICCVDVTDRDAMAAWVEDADRASSLDLVIANAGVSGGTAGGGEGAAQTRAIFAVNVDGVLNTLLPVLPAMRGRGGGQVALMSSLAAFRGLPGSPAYSASKAAVRLWGEALAGAERRHGIRVSVICPGFVETPMTAVNSYAMPMLMPAERAAAIIRRGLTRGRQRIAFPLPMYLMAWLLGTLPPVFTDAMLRRLPEKS